MASEGMRKLWCLSNKFVTSRLIPHGEPIIASFSRFLLNKNNVPVITADDISVPLIDTTTGKIATALIPSTPGLGDLLAANNLSDLPNVATARTNLGLGSSATHPSTDFDAAGSAATAQSTAISAAAADATTKANAAQAAAIAASDPLGAADDANATSILSKPIVDAVADGKYLKYDAAANTGSGGWVLVDAVAGNPFDQELNTTDSPSFGGLTLDGNTFDASVIGACGLATNGPSGLVQLDSTGATLTLNGTPSSSYNTAILMQGSTTTWAFEAREDLSGVWTVNNFLLGSFPFIINPLAPTDTLILNSNGYGQFGAGIILAGSTPATGINGTSGTLLMTDGDGGSLTGVLTPSYFSSDTGHFLDGTGAFQPLTNLGAGSVIQRVAYTGGVTATAAIASDSTKNILAFLNGSTSSTTLTVTLPTGGFDGQTLDISYKTASGTIAYAGATQIGGITVGAVGSKQRFIWDNTLTEWR